MRQALSLPFGASEPSADSPTPARALDPVSNTPHPAADMLTLLQQRDPAAERAFYEQHVERVHRLCSRMTGQEVLAQECTQDAFVRAFDRIDTFRGDSSLATWLHAIAVSVVLNALRREKRMASRSIPLSAAEGLAARHPVAEPDLRARLKEAIDDLPPGYRAVFLMHDVEGFTHAEIGAALGVASGTSKTQLFNARRKLRDALAPFMTPESR